jgi:hypothetical protein
MRKECQRRPNTFCQICNKPVYRRPGQLAKQKVVYCSQECHKELARKIPCPVCSELFVPSRTNSKNCSRTCANKAREGLKYKQNGGVKKEFKNHSERRLHTLKENFDFDSCMIENCGYNKTYDIHRLVPGCNGGLYEIGNMFAICPNHHAEVHRNIVVLEKISDCELKAIYKEE